MSFQCQSKASNRRDFLGSTGAALIAVAGADAAVASETDRELMFVNLDQAMAEVKSLVQARSLTSQTQWSLPKTLAHAAQSIEYSLTGFPQPKSALFQHTVGAAAIAVFDLRGRMSHSLVEPIPGAPALDGSMGIYQVLERLEMAVARFRVWTAPLQPHFAYGALSKPAYERAHAMHLANHLSAFREGSGAERTTWA